MAEVRFLTIHARALVCIADDPDVRLRDIALRLNISERNVWATIEDLISAGYVVKEKEGRRNRYTVQVDAPMDEANGRRETVGELLDALVGSPTRRRKITS